MQAASVVVAALLLGATCSDAPAAAQETKMIELSARTFRAIEVAVKELEAKMGYCLEDSGLGILACAGKNRTVVIFGDPNRGEWEAAVSGSRCSASP